VIEADIERVIQSLRDRQLADSQFLAGANLSKAAVWRAMTRYDAVLRANGSAERRAFSGANMDPASPEKSVLFLRLIMGKQPLRDAPPTTFSLPCYALVEEPGPIAVVVRGPIPLGGQRDRAGGARGKYWFAVSDCLYACIDDNEPARKVNILLTGEHASQFPSRTSLIARQPVWMLRHGNWPAWMLVWDHDNEARQYRPGWVLRKTAEWAGYSIEYLDV
jgi:hypothetical protein